MKYFSRFSAMLAAAVIGSFLGMPRVDAEQNFLGLSSGWSIQSSVLTDANGATISTETFRPADWHPATVPGTVLATLVKDGTYTNIYFGTNLATIPTAPFTNAWWYRNEFKVSHEQSSGSADLIFDGINYRANIWLNGVQIASADNTFGAYRVWQFNVSGHLKSGRNVLAVEVFPPKPGDFTMGFVDWNPKPPDRNMGLFRPVQLHFYKSVAIKNVFVESKIDHENWQQAELTVRADLVNRAPHTVETTVTGKIGDRSFSEQFTLAAGETRAVRFTPAECPALKFTDAKLWWPWELGQPNLYELKMTATVDNKVSDRNATRFGLREVKDYINADGHRGYMVNGKKLLIRGGGWADELLLKEDPANLRAQIEYTKAMNLNAIRLEGVWGSSQQLYSLADEYGLLIMVGWSCQWEWPDSLGKKTDPHYGGFQTETDMNLATNYLHDQVFWLRNHPSILMWVVGSDMLPNPVLERRYDALFPIIDPTRPVLKSCGTVTSKVSGPSGVKMNGPYDYVTPNYWYEDTNNGGAFGFNTETGPGPQPPPLETLERMLPADHLWPVDDFWQFHAGRGNFHTINRYMKAFNARYGAAKSAPEFAFKSQAANYEAIRTMYEAFAVNRPHTTGIIQWMLNASWPKLYWQLYDYYLVPGGAFYGVKKGAAPVEVIYNYGDHGVYLSNQGTNAFAHYQTKITAYDLNSKKILDQTVTNTSHVGSSQKIFDLSQISPDTTVYFVDLQGSDATVAGSDTDNFYWLSTKADVLDEDKTEWYVTPNKSFADFTTLANLPVASVKAKVSFHKRHGQGEAEVTLTNTGTTLAFFIELKITGKKSKQILTPVFWDDNYISLPPGAKRVLHVRFPAGETPELKLQGWNVAFKR